MSLIKRTQMNYRSGIKPLLSHSFEANVEVIYCSPCMLVCVYVCVGEGLGWVGYYRNWVILTRLVLPPMLRSMRWDQ